MSTIFLLDGELLLEIYCIACDIVHSYRFKLRDVVDRPLQIISCPESGIEIGFIGKYFNVNEILKSYIDYGFLTTLI